MGLIPRSTQENTFRRAVVHNAPGNTCCAPNLTGAGQGMASCVAHKDTLVTGVQQCRPRGVVMDLLRDLGKTTKSQGSSSAWKDTDVGKGTWKFTGDAGSWAME